MDELGASEKDWGSYDGESADAGTHARRTIFDRILGRLPNSLTGYIDHLRPGLKSSWGGSLNGQERRREMMKELVSLLRPQVIVETGTYRGASTTFLSDVSGADVYTVEHDKRFFKYSQLRFRKNANIKVFEGDSRDFLKQWSRENAFQTGNVLFYLDAHWGPDLPLWEELEIIQRTWARSAIVIDDFRVPDDDGYGYDDWGAHNRLSEDCLPTTIRAHYRILYPTASSFTETGKQRGCVVLLSHDLPTLKLTTLRETR